MKTTCDISDIMKYLPHRYPFLLIDRILALEAHERVVALKNVTINEPFFRGHFPGKPIMPGVLIMEAIGQAGGVLIIESLPPEKYGSLVYFMGVDKVRFRKPVTPGDQLRIELTIIKERTKAVKMAGIAYVEDNKVAEGEFLATIGEKI